MDFLQTIVSFSLGTLVPFLFVLTVVVFFHELGHFQVARWCGVKVDAFSVGFGPEIFGWTDRQDTRWKVCWVPLGGYVKFHGDAGAASMPDTEKLERMAADGAMREVFHFKPLWQRAAVVAAGPIANFILAILIFAAIFMTAGQRTTPAQVDEIVPGSAAEAAGLRAGDIVREINGRKMRNFSDLQRLVSTSAEVPLRMVVDRSGTILEVTAVPAREEITDANGTTHKIGVLGVKRQTEEADWTHERYSAPVALWKGVEETGFVIERTLNYVGRLIVGQESADQLGGPIKIAQVSGQAADISFLALINLAAVLSVSIGLINLFPIPLLDGGHLAYYSYEAVAGRPMSEKAQEIGFRIGFAFVVMLMLFATWNDIT
ncbi:MAG: RIP metalloprotease RseP [Pseudomonadota bacterium]